VDSFERKGPCGTKEIGKGCTCTVLGAVAHAVANATGVWSRICQSRRRKSCRPSAPADLFRERSARRCQALALYKSRGAVDG
jgi:CO/xanthine dehydrogenase Mo-binding subunit